MKIGIIGCGAIAGEIISHLDNVVAVYDIYPERCQSLPVKNCKSLDDLMENSDFIIEAASPQAVREYATKIIESGKDLLIMSVGGLADREYRETLFSKAYENGVRIYLPSGAIGGLDLIRTAKIAGIENITLKSTKNAKTLGIACSERTRIFKGSAAEAIEKLPKSANVSVLLSIVSGMEVDVEIYADPEVKENIHEISIRGKFGEANIVIRNKTSDKNPKTSYLAAISPISVINLMDSPIVAGV